MKIICYGDSNTYGWDPRDIWGNPYESPWPLVLSEKLGIPVQNLGQPGREIPLPGPFLDSLAAGLKPKDWLLIMLGTNDLLNGLNRSAESVAKQMDDLLFHLLQNKPQGHLLLITPPVISISDRERNQASLELGQYYQALAEKYQIHYYDAGTLHLELAYDGIHLTQDAHEILGQKLSYYIRRTK